MMIRVPALCTYQLNYNYYYYIPKVKVPLLMCFIGRGCVTCESDEIRLSPSHQRERETTRYSPVNNEKNPKRHHVQTRPLDRIDIVVFQIKFIRH